MARITLVGGGVCGLAAGLLLARDGHDVTLFERDGSPAPDSPQEAWEVWARDGVTQFHQAHLLQPAGCAVLEDELPDVFAALVAAGAMRLDTLALMPPSLTDRAPRAGDERFITYTARRPVIESVLANAAEAQPRLEIRRGAAVRGLTVADADGAPHVTGVVLEGGESQDADLVVDAMGRGSQLPRWLSAAGIAPLREESEDSGFIYYTKFFRSTGGDTPRAFAPLLSAMGTFSLLTLPADNHTWSVTTYVSSGDKPLKAMRDPELWTEVVSACPLQAHWLQGESISDMLAMGGVVDRYRSLSVDGRPLVTGLALMGDAWSCTNPSLGRGMTLGLLHARSLRDVAGAHLDDRREFADAWHAVTEAELTPWYRATVEEDRSRLREIEALRDGRDPVSGEPSTTIREATLAALQQDADIFRVFLEDRCTLRPLSESLAEDGMRERILELAGDYERQPLPGPSRADLLALLD